MTMQDGERQVAPTLDGIRRDHVARYQWAADRVSGRVLDACCGVGYGCAVLANSRGAPKVLGIDADAEAIAYAREHYRRPGAEFRRADATKAKLQGFDTAVCFEAIEHLEDPRPMLRGLRSAAKRLIASVPNEDAFPWQGYDYHFRHYTKQQLEALLAECGWRVTGWSGQAGDESDVEDGLTTGRTLIATAVHCAPQPAAIIAPPQKPAAPAHVAILGLGPSLEQFLNFTKRLGGREAFCDEVWGINALGDVLNCDRIFHMDDVRIQEIRAAADPRSNIAVMLAWLKKHPGPIVTSRAHPDYPGLVEFPLEAVVNDLQFAYFNSTTAYAVAYAIWLGVKKITLFGIDYTYANAHQAEKGRACVEFWLGIAAARGIKLGMPQVSSLMDACTPLSERLYGYDTLDVRIQTQRVGPMRMRFIPRSKLPTAEEIEARYDHNRHPNPLVESEARA